MVARVRLKGGQKIYYKPHSLLLAEQYQKIENWLWEKMGLEESRHLVVSGDDYGWEQEVTEAACKCTKHTESIRLLLIQSLCLIAELKLVHKEKICSRI